MMAAGSILLFFFFFTLFDLKGASVLADSCRTPSCKSSEYSSVNFPFRIPQYQPNTRCGYDSNFSLYCSPTDQTMFHLPNTEDRFTVKNIDYTYQRISVADPARCLPRRFLTIDFSASPFSYYSYNYTYTYYNCTNLLIDFDFYFHQVQCMSDKNYTVFTISSHTNDTLASNRNCTLIKSNVSAPSSLAFFPDSFVSLDLHWAEPKCGQCTYKEVCGFKGDTNLIECKQDTTVPTLMLLMAVTAYKFRSRNTTRTEHQAQTGITQMQQSNNTTALNVPSTESSHPVFVLDEGDVLLEPNSSPCAICLCEYKGGDTLRTIEECNHYFHSDCVDEWLRRKATCPVCRKGA